jgi:D-glycero-alpha-D-manno-heptose-7-phosphate kinase
MIITQTPFRASFFGGGTDFPHYYREHGGATLSTTLGHYCYISVHHLSPFFKHRYRASYAKTELVQNPDEFEHPLVRECLLDLDFKDTVEISHVADLPGRTGLGSSSAFTVGLLNALRTYRNEKSGAQELAEQAIRIERERVRDIGGHQDQYAAAFGGLLHIDYGPGEGVSVQSIKLTAARQRAFEESCLMFYTGMDRSAQHILAEQASRTEANRTTLARMHGYVQQAVDLLTSEEELTPFGELLHDSWTLKRSLANGISNDKVSQVYESARQAGAIGGKLLGAGGRGFILLFVPKTKQQAVRRAISSLQEVPFSMSSHGSSVIFKEA